ncbi:MAG: methyltransferase domain-containing protein [Actinomycetota bacterium]
MGNELDAAVEAARAYEALHVPALFAQWADPLLDRAGVADGDDVLDVACGTGALTRRAVERTGRSGSVTGVDVGPGMLVVAGETAPGATLLESDAASIPVDDDSFDVALCQFGLMFMPEPAAVLAEMARSVRPGGRIGVAVWEALERSPAYPITVDLLQRRAGSAAADALRAPFVHGDTDQLVDFFRSAGLADTAVDTQVGTARFPSVRVMVEADLRGWLPVMGVELDDELIEALLAEAEDLLAEFVTVDGTMVFDAPAHLAVAAV